MMLFGRAWLSRSPGVACQRGSSRMDGQMSQSLTPYFVLTFFFSSLRLGLLLYLFSILSLNPPPAAAYDL